MQERRIDQTSRTSADRFMDTFQPVTTGDAVAEIFGYELEEISAVFGLDLTTLTLGISAPARIRSYSARFAMAQPAFKRNPCGRLSSGFATSDRSEDLAIKALIDDLIVPYWVEEFLRLHGPGGAANAKDEGLPEEVVSELNSTP